MAIINPGIGDALIDCVTSIQAQENAAGDNTVEGHAIKSILCRNILLLTHVLDRGDGTNALDYEDGDRTTFEQHYKRQLVGLIATLLQRLNAEPQRTWPEVVELAGILADLTTTEDTSWRREIVRLGQAQAATIARATTQGGVAAFDTPGGTVSACVYKARTPDVPLEGVAVYLLEMIAPEGAVAPTGRYALMVDDPWWGRRIQPAEFAEAPLSEEFVMGYRLQGRILQNGQPIAEANVSLEAELASVEDGRVIAWDSVEYNELAWDSELETWVEAATVRAPIMTGLDGRWETIVPRGHGALYQRAGDLRDGTAETARRGLVRHLVEVRQAFRGRQAPVVEGQESVLDILCGKLEISGEPGTMVRVGMLDDPGTEHVIPAGGTLTLSRLPEAEHNVVAYKLTAWGTWDSGWGCARQVADVKRGQTASVSLGAMEQYATPDVICGRVYERSGVPAAGLAIVLIDPFLCEVVGTLATTDGAGWWQAQVPAGGLGGQPAIHDACWGSLPVVGTPYSDVVLGARAYASAAEEYKPEAWRRPLRGHKNFQYCADSIVVRDSVTGESFETEETGYGGWVTVETLPKFRYAEDLQELVWWGAQRRVYEIEVDGEDKLPPFELRGQPFDSAGGGEGEFRAAGYYPEQKVLIGGKISGNVVRGHPTRIDGGLPEAARVGLEFGEHEAYVEARSLSAGEAKAAMADLVCPYCGGPAWRDPDGAYLRGFCMQCADAFGRADAIDCRTHFVTPTLAGAGDLRYRMRFVRLNEREGSWSRRVDGHWRPDLYDETDDFASQSGAGQVTNAPRWVARHVDEIGDAKGFGHFDGNAAQPWTLGHDLGYYEALPEIDRPLGVAALKLAFAPGYVTPLTYTVEIDCVRADGQTETRTVTVPVGAAGASAGDEFGDVVPVVTSDKLIAERAGYSWAEVGLYRGVADVRLVEPASAPGCCFAIVNDAPLLASPEGVPVESERATPVAVQMVGEWGDPHLLDDAVGQIFLFYTRGGDVMMQKRAGLPAEWQPEQRITEGSDAAEPWAGKSACGELTVVCSRRGGRLSVLRSLNDGRTWEEVR